MWWCLGCLFGFLTYSVLLLLSWVFWVISVVVPTVIGTENHMAYSHMGSGTCFFLFRKAFSSLNHTVSLFLPDHCLSFHCLPNRVLIGSTKFVSWLAAVRSSVVSMNTETAAASVLSQARHLISR